MLHRRRSDGEHEAASHVVGPGSCNSVALPAPAKSPLALSRMLKAVPINQRTGAEIGARMRAPTPDNGDENMNGNRYYGVRVEGAKYGVSFGSALAIAISYTANHSILWAIIHGVLGWLYVIYYALFKA
jgi:hypothetical protein